MGYIVEKVGGKPYWDPTFAAFHVSTEVLERYVGVYGIPGTPAKLTVSEAAAED